jgi:multidrug efflux pump subunit AcrA (membrane-fusion protein)
LITGTYTKGDEGSITFTVNQAGSSGYATFSGLINTTVSVSTTAPQAIADSGLFIEFPSASQQYTGTTWKINIPNTNAPNYLTNYNAYQMALQNKNQATENAQAALDQANASLTALQTSARPEDVASAQAQMDNALGAVQIAQAAYQNTIISAPSDGTVVSVAITPGQIAVPNTPAIQFSAN